MATPPFISMKIRIFGNVMVGGIWHDQGVGEYSSELAEHLISLGVAEPFETKVVEQMEVKAGKKSGPVSQAAPVSQEKIASASDTLTASRSTMPTSTRRGRKSSTRATRNGGQ